MLNLALTATPLIGRSQEINEISALLDDPACRLLTLVGPGGIGKTRLALEIAAQKQASFADGVYVVQLAPLSWANDIVTTIVEAMPYRFQQDKRDTHEQFFDYLREKQSKQVLLVLDNFEHLLDGVHIISAILAATSHYKILVTSREALNLQEEWVRNIDGLTYPEQENGVPLESYGAVQLFVDRARHIRGDFDLAEDRQSVLEICRLVEGMPLAIELAAGWLKTLQPADIAQEIQSNMDILATRARNLPERHRSIRSVFSHSWRLLQDDERSVFQELSVFRGGFTREAAQIVTGTSLHTLAGLIDKSLVRLNAAGRYDIHELLRQFGAEHLEAAHQTVPVQRAYIGYYLGILSRLDDDIKSNQQIAALDTIEVDFENVRNAWQLAAQQGHFEALNGAVESLQFFGDMRGRYHEVVMLLQMAIEQFPQALSPEDEYVLRRIQARLIRIVLLGNLRIDFDVQTQIDASLAAARARNDEPEIGFCLMVAGIVAMWQVDKSCAVANPLASTLFQQSYEVYARLEDPFYMAEGLIWHVAATSVEGHDAKRDGIQRSLDLRREIGDRNGIAWITLNLCEFTYDDLNYPEVERYAREALGLMREIRSLKGILQSMFKLAQMVILKGELEEGRSLNEQMTALVEATNNLDGKMLALGISALLKCVMDEAYAEALSLSQASYTLSQEPYFGGHNNMGTRWAQPAAEVGLGDFDEVRCAYADLFVDRYDDPGPATMCLVLEAAVLNHEVAPEQAVEMLGLAFEQPIWAMGWLKRWALVTRLRADLRRQLGDEAFQAAWERGCQLDLKTTISTLISTPDTSSVLNANQALLEPLSERELEVLALIAEGLSNRDIAERLVLSVGTVKVHTRNIYGKLNVNSRTQALAQAAKFHLLDGN